jgi:hypothetical protein
LASAEQGTRPIGGQFGVFQRRLQLRHNRLLRREVGLEWTPFEKIEPISRLDLVALFEQPLFQKRGDTRDHVDPVDRLDPSEKLAAFRNRSLDRFDDSHRWGPTCGWLRPGCRGRSEHNGTRRQQTDGDSCRVHLRLPHRDQRFQLAHFE